jgi:hypothetical protein
MRPERNTVREYERPVLTYHGTIAERTAGGGTVNNSDNSFNNTKTNGSPSCTMAFGKCDTE